MKFYENLEKLIIHSMLYRGGFVGSILTDLSKANDCLKDDMLLAKLQACSFSKKV